MNCDIMISRVFLPTYYLLSKRNFLSNKTISFHFYCTKVSGNPPNVHISTFKIKVFKSYTTCDSWNSMEGDNTENTLQVCQLCTCFLFIKIFLEQFYIILMEYIWKPEFWGELYFEKKFKFSSLEIIDNFYCYLLINFNRILVII